jgi:histidine triad (HIT) family protein
MYMPQVLMLDLKNCIFCKIVAGTFHAKIITQNDKAIAFLDAFPLSAGHTLIIPKSHYSKIQDMDAQHSYAVFDLLRIVSAAVENAVGVNASIIAIHNGKEAGQDIPHLHVHIIPRNIGDGAGPVHSMFKNRPKYTSLEMDFMLDNIKRSSKKFDISFA